LTFTQFSPSAGIIYRAFENSSLYANYSSAFQTPSANELGNSPEGGFNRVLRPERIRSFEAGCRTFFENFFAEIAAFHFTADNQLIPYQVSAASDVTYFRNAGQT
ncbi:MAG TPA: TonB-dependent receptor, partial [Patescibacteria group bacterium]|nr:TonB-dependent receptor [Patescibacteria group bacterium]